MAQVDPTIWNGYARYYAKWLGFPENFFIAQAAKESSYNSQTGQYNNVCNWLGSCGILQIQKPAMQDVTRFFKLGNLSPLDPYQSIVIAAAYMVVLNYYIKHRLNYDALADGEWPVLAVAYNGGWTAGVFYALNGYAPSYESRYYVGYIDSYINSMA
jgi:hypothetical protein